MRHTSSLYHHQKKELQIDRKREGLKSIFAAQNEKICVKR